MNWLVRGASLLGRRLGRSLRRSAAISARFMVAAAERALGSLLVTPLVLGRLLVFGSVRSGAAAGRGRAGGVTVSVSAARLAAAAEAAGKVACFVAYRRRVEVRVRRRLRSATPRSALKDRRRGRDPLGSGWRVQWVGNQLTVENRAVDSRSRPKARHVRFRLSRYRTPYDLAQEVVREVMVAELTLLSQCMKAA